MLEEKSERIGWSTVKIKVFSNKSGCLLSLFFLPFYSLIIFKIFPVCLFLSNSLSFLASSDSVLCIYYLSYSLANRLISKLNSFESIHFLKTSVLVLLILFFWYVIMSAFNLHIFLCDTGYHLLINIKTPAVNWISSKSLTALVWPPCSHLPRLKGSNTKGWFSWTEGMLTHLGGSMGSMLSKVWKRERSLKKRW